MIGKIAGSATLFTIMVLVCCLFCLARGREVRGVLQDGPGPIQMVPVTFETDNGWRYDGRIELPPREVRRPWAVMLLGGGMGTAIDWRVPGIMTLDGKPTRDADTIARALLKRGFVVMRWQAIRRNDPKFAESGLMFDAGSFEQTVEQSRKAMAAFRAEQVVPDDHIFLVGHSLGALRGAMLIGSGTDVPGLVMLAGAKLIPSKLDTVRRFVARATADLDSSARGDLDEGARHEYILSVLGAHREDWKEPVDSGRTQYGTPWPAAVIARNGTPALLIVGSLDERWLLESYVFTDYLRRRSHPDYTWRVYENLGHNLGPEQPGDVHYQDYGVIAHTRTGPMAARVVQELVEWIEARAK